MNEQEYINYISSLSNEELIEEIVQVNQYVPEAMTPTEVVENMHNICKNELLNRML